jgi:hypothetical protein
MNHFLRLEPSNLVDQDVFLSLKLWCQSYNMTWVASFVNSFVSVLSGINSFSRQWMTIASSLRLTSWWLTMNTCSLRDPIPTPRSSISAEEEESELIESWYASYLTIRHFSINAYESPTLTLTKVEKVSTIYIRVRVEPPESKTRKRFSLTTS